MRYGRKGMLVGLVGTVMGATLMLTGTVLATLPGGAGIALESIGRATLGSLNLTQSNFKVIAHGPHDVVIAELIINADGDTGWHTHPGPTFATVREGRIALTVLDKHGACTTTVYGPGQGFAEPANLVHIAQSLDGAPAVLNVTFLNIPLSVDTIPAVIDWAPPAPTGSGC